MNFDLLPVYFFHLMLLWETFMIVTLQKTIDENQLNAKFHTIFPLHFITISKMGPLARDMWKLK